MTRLIVALLPYVAVLIGMYVMHSSWWAIGLYHAGIVSFLAVQRSAGMLKRLRTGYRTPLLIPSVLICGLAAPVVYFLWPWMTVSDGGLMIWMAHYGLTGRAWILLIPYFSIIHPVLEELFWRQISPERFAILCPQDVLFAGYHTLVLFQLVSIPWLALVFSVLACSSIFWRWSVIRYDGYAFAILTHAAADAGVMIGICLLLG